MDKEPKYTMYAGGLVPIPEDADLEWYAGLLRALGIKEEYIEMAINIKVRSSK